MKARQGDAAIFPPKGKVGQDPGHDLSAKPERNTAPALLSNFRKQGLLLEVQKGKAKPQAEPELKVKYR